jgi:mandelate racemase
VTASALTVRSVRARAVVVPMRRPLVTAGGSTEQAPLVLVDVLTESGITGCAYLFSPTPVVLKPLIELLRQTETLLQGRTAAPLEVQRHLRSTFTLLGTTGLVGMVIAVLDMALWDIQAKAVNVPLARLLGSDTDRVPAYNSTGLGLMGPLRCAEEAVELLEHGFGAVKLRLGYSSLDEDLAAVRAVREAVSGCVMSDYNQALSVPEALRRGRALDGEGLHWIEEPVRADDYHGHATISRVLGTPIQIGENFWWPQDMRKALDAEACDYVMPDLMRIGGVTGFLRAAGMAAAHDMPLSSHLFPEISAHLLAAAETRHWLEYVDWANPILHEPLRIEQGQAVIPQRPGHGMSWDEAAVARYELS